MAVVVYSASQLLTFVFAPAPTTPKSPPTSILCMAGLANPTQPGIEQAFGIRDDGASVLSYLCQFVPLQACARAPL